MKSRVKPMAPTVEDAGDEDAVGAPDPEVILDEVEQASFAGGCKDEHLFERAFMSDLGAPQTIEDALEHDDGELWRAAAKEEIDSMENLGVWEKVPLPTG